MKNWYDDIKSGHLIILKNGKKYIHIDSDQEDHMLWVDDFGDFHEGVFINEIHSIYGGIINLNDEYLNIEDGRYDNSYIFNTKGRKLIWSNEYELSIPEIENKLNIPRGHLRIKEDENKS